jgi:hypothetical protein
MASNYHIFVSGIPGSPEDWRDAMSAPESEIPPLDEGGREVARRMHIDEKDVARGKLVAKLSRDRELKRAQVLGDAVDEILLGIGSSYYQLSAVLRNQATQLRWIVRLITPKGVKELEIPPELVERLVEKRQEGKEQLRILVLGAVGREDLLSQHAS